MVPKARDYRTCKWIFQSLSNAPNTHRAKQAISQLQELARIQRHQKYTPDHTVPLHTEDDDIGFTKFVSLHLN